MKKEISIYLEPTVATNMSYWWITWVYSNGKTKESNEYDDVPNFKAMNECAINMADKTLRQEYVRNAIAAFENSLLNKLKY